MKKKNKRSRELHEYLVSIDSQHVTYHGYRRPKIKVRRKS